MKNVSLRLGIETSGLKTGLALVRGENLLIEREEAAGPRHSDIIFDLLAGVLRDSGARLADLTGVGVSIGPGMFTALRVGLSLAKALALACALPVRGVNALDALAWPLRQRAEPVVATADARKGQVFAARFEQGRRVSDYLILDPAGLVRLIDRPTLVIGAGFERYQAEITAAAGPSLLPGDHRPLFPSAVAIARLAGADLDAGRADDPDRLEPFYLRPADAELGTRRRSR